MALGSKVCFDAENALKLIFAILLHEPLWFSPTTNNRIGIVGIGIERKIFGVALH